MFNYTKLCLLLKLELRRLSSNLDLLLSSQRRLYLLQAPLDLAVNLFAYVGAVASFLVIAVPIFSGYYDELTEPELANLISENAFVCINLVSIYDSNIYNDNSDNNSNVDQICSFSIR